MPPERRTMVTRNELTATKGVGIPAAQAFLRCMNVILLERIQGLKFKILYSKDHVALGIIMEDEGASINTKRRKTKSARTGDQPGAFLTLGVKN